MQSILQKLLLFTFFVSALPASAADKSVLAGLACRVRFAGSEVAGEQDSILDRPSHLGASGKILTPRMVIEKLKRRRQLDSVRDLTLGKKGIWRLAKAPTYSDYLYLREALVGFRGEIQIVKFLNVWVFTVSHEPRTYPIPEIDQFEDLVSFDLHSHPGTDPLADVPSIADGESVMRMNIGMLILTHNGLIQFFSPEIVSDFLPEFRMADRSVERMYFQWYMYDLKLSQRAYDSIGQANLLKMFFRKFFGARHLNHAEIAGMFSNLD